MTAAPAFTLPATRPGAPDTDFANARLLMMEGQITPAAIIQPAVLAAFAKIPREAFVPAEQRSIAYNDRTLQWADGFLLAPTTLAQLFEAAAAQADETALVLCADSAYPAAIASHIFAEVIALDADSNAGKTARNILTQLNIENIASKAGPLDKGWSRNAPYDVIILAGAAASLPQNLTKQLKEGGRLIGVFPDAQGTPRIMLYLKLHGTLSHRVIADATAPYLPGFEPIQKFTF